MMASAWVHSGPVDEELGIAICHYAESLSIGGGSASLPNASASFRALLCMTDSNEDICGKALEGLRVSSSRSDDIRQQIEFYFSDKNLCRDDFFRDLVLTDADGWVDANTSVLQCPRIQQLNVSQQELVSALRDSLELEVDAQLVNGTCTSCRIRRKRPFTSSRNADDTGKSKGKGKGKRGGPVFDPSTPCGYYIAGNCRHGERCTLQHSVPFALAIRHEWLHPENSTAKEALRTAADHTLGHDVVSSVRLFPRVFSRTSGTNSASKANTKGRADCRGRRWGRQSKVDTGTIEDLGFSWDSEQPGSTEIMAAASSLPSALSRPETPQLRYLLVLDLEGKDEIIEFPVILIDTKLHCEVGRFQRYVRPMELFEGCALTPESPAVQFPVVLKEFDAWLRETICLSLDDFGSSPSNAAFVTCGDWDCKHVHTQCNICSIPTPTAFRQWVNIKRSFSEAYNGDFRGMKSMLARLGLLDSQGDVLHGFHHLGMHDVENIGRCVMHLLKEGFDLTINGWKR